MPLRPLPAPPRPTWVVVLDSLPWLLPSTKWVAQQTWLPADNSRQQVHRGGRCPDHDHVNLESKGSASVQNLQPVLA